MGRAPLLVTPRTDLDLLLQSPGNFVRIGNSAPNAASVLPERAHDCRSAKWRSSLIAADTNRRGRAWRRMPRRPKGTPVTIAQGCGEIDQRIREITTPLDALLYVGCLAGFAIMNLDAQNR